jgi:RNA polymerase sigma factor (sigma-70 family)
VREGIPKLTVIAGGKPAAERFAALIEQHYDALYRTAYRLTRSRHDAEDLVQELCARAFPRLVEIEQLDTPRAWLMRVMYRLFVDFARRYERRNVESMEIADVNSFCSDEPDPAHAADAAREKERLDRAWQRLDEEQRALLALHDIEGYSLAELNEMTGLKEGTLKSRLHRARVRLGRLLEREASVVARAHGFGAAR